MKRLFGFACSILILTLSPRTPLHGQDAAGAAPPAGVAPVIQTPAAVRGLSWDSTGELFSYMEKDTILLRSSAAPYRHLGSVELPGVLDYSLYHESDSGVQLIAGASDGTMAVWSIPLTSTTPPPYIF